MILPVACFRAMFMNKPAHEGTQLTWHQDRWRDLDRDPQITIYTALDPAMIENGCVHIIPKSHSTLINPENGSGFLTQDHIDDIVAKATPLPMELRAGEVVLTPQLDATQFWNKRYGYSATGVQRLLHAW